MTKELRKTIAALLVAHDEVEEARRVAVSQVQTAESVGVTTVLAAEKCEAAEATTVRTAAKFIISLLTLLYHIAFFDYIITKQMVDGGHADRSHYKHLARLVALGLVLNLIKFCVLGLIIDRAMHPELWVGRTPG